MVLPILLSVPHAGLDVPPEVEGLSLLTPAEIAEDGDGGAAEVYDLEDEVVAFVTTGVARAFVDMNRAPDDVRRDGVVKTHTCWDVPIYREPLGREQVAQLIARYHRPYHDELTASAAGRARVGIDGHTMAAVGPPMGPGPGEERPPICISNGDGTCPDDWLHRLAGCMESVFDRAVSINRPFRGGYIIRHHATELPWIQVEISRADFMPLAEKRARLLESLSEWCTERWQA